MEKIITTTDLGNGNFIRKYDILDLAGFVNSDRTIISLQKSVCKILPEILSWIGIENLDSKILQENISRAWFFSIDSKDFWEIWFLLTKWQNSTKSFAKVSNYYLWWTDIWDKIENWWNIRLKKESEIPSEVLWWYKTELLLLLWNVFIKNYQKNKNTELDILTTKFTPTLTKKAIEQLPKNMKEPGIDTVDSNSELNIQVQEILSPWNNVGAVEIVQSWSSLQATNSYPVKDWIIYKPSLRDKESWDFLWDKIWELDPNSQVWIIAKNIQSEVKIAFYNLLTTRNKWNNPDFVNAIKNSMKNF